MGRVPRRAPTSAGRVVTAAGRHTAHGAHLARRFVTSVSRREPEPQREEWARSMLLPGERALWLQMSAADRRHSIEVARRFRRMVETVSRAEMAAVLLHDVGKLDSGLGTAARVVATVVGPRTARLRRYHDHEAIGVDMLTAAGSEPETLALARGEHPYVHALRVADQV